MYAQIISFNGGEITPKMLGRIDLNQYGRSCLKLENFIVNPYGSAERRKGTLNIGQFNGFEVLFSFSVAQNENYILLFGEKQLVIIDDYSNADPITLVTPYSLDELKFIKKIQSNDVAFFVSPASMVMELKRVGKNEFTFQEFNFDYIPTSEINLDNDLKISASSTTLEINLSATKDFFAPEDEGELLTLVHQRESNSLNKDFVSNATTNSIEVFGYWDLTTGGTWKGTLKLQRSLDDGATWIDYRIFSSNFDSNTATSGNEEERNVLYRLQMQNYVQAAEGVTKLCKATLYNPNYKVTGIVRITDVITPLRATAIVLKKLGNTTPTKDFYRAAFSKKNGYPRTIAFYNERLIFGGTKAKVNTIWGSRINDWSNFLLGDLADDAFEFTLASNTLNEIKWLLQHDSLVIGTNDSEWTLSSEAKGESASPNKLKLQAQSAYGCSDNQSLIVGDTILFTQAGGKKVREFIYSFEKDGYVSPDLTLLAEHITKSQIISAAIQKKDNQILWCVLGSNEVAALSYERDQEVNAWQRITTQGKFLSVAVAPGDEDTIYFLVKRGEDTFLERLAKSDENIYTDSTIILQNNDEKISLSESPLLKFKSQNLQLSIDGGSENFTIDDENNLVFDSKITNSIYCGFAYTSSLIPMPFELELQDGLSLMRLKAIQEIRLVVQNSVGGKVRVNNSNYQEIQSRSILDDYFDEAPKPKSEIVRLNFNCSYDYQNTVEIIQDEPLPLTICNIAIIYKVKE